VLALSPKQRSAWLDAIIDAEGHAEEGFTRLAQNDGAVAEAINPSPYTWKVGGRHLAAFVAGALNISQAELLEWPVPTLRQACCSTQYYAGSGGLRSRYRTWQLDNATSYHNPDRRIKLGIQLVSKAVIVMRDDHYRERFAWWAQLGSNQCPSLVRRHQTVAERRRMSPVVPASCTHRRRLSPCVAPGAASVGSPLLRYPTRVTARDSTEKPFSLPA
jgi:hypothetical protein